VVFASGIEAVSLTDVFQRCCTIDRKHAVDDTVFVVEFSKERVSERIGLCRFEPSVE
jgi:hypothetical protein